MTSPVVFFGSALFRPTRFFNMATNPKAMEHAQVISVAIGEFLDQEYDGCFPSLANYVQTKFPELQHHLVREAILIGLRQDNDFDQEKVSTLLQDHMVGDSKALLAIPCRREITMVTYQTQYLTDNPPSTRSWGTAHAEAADFTWSKACGHRLRKRVRSRTFRT